MVLQERQDIRRTFSQFASDVMTRVEFKTAFANITRLIQLAISDLSARIDKRFSELEATEKELSARVDKKLRGVDGYTPVKGKDYVDGYTPVKGKDYFDGKDGVTPVAGVHFQVPQAPDEEAIARRVAGNVFPKMVAAFKKSSLAASLRDALMSLEGDKRIPFTAIHGLPEHVNELLSKTGTYYGGNAVSVLQSGTMKAQTAAALNFKGSAAPTVSIGANGVTDITFTSGGVSPTTPTGTVDGSNTVFTAPASPNIVYADGMARIAGFGFTLSGTGPYTITMDIAPQQYIIYI